MCSPVAGSDVFPNSGKLCVLMCSLVEGSDEIPEEKRGTIRLLNLICL
jgi:hypothetical protein